MAALEFGVMLSQQMKTHNAVNVGISNGDVVSRRAHLVQIHEALGQPEQDVRLAIVRLQSN